MSYRDRYNRTTGVSGYRSQPVSNRSSLYLPTDYNVSNVSNDLSDFDRQFKKLLERTEKFTNRVEKLQTTSTHIKKGFRRIDNTVTGIRSQRDVIETAFDNIENRLYNDVADPPTTEEEWKRFLDAEILIEKAIELMRSRYRYPKPLFEYSPEGRSPYSFDISSNTSLVSNPASPNDAEGNQIRDLGSELKPIYPVSNETFNTVKKKDTKTLPIVAEIEEQTECNTNTFGEILGKKSDSTPKEIEKVRKSNGFRSSKIFDDIGSEGKSEHNSIIEENSEETLTRRPSFLRTLISNRKKNRPMSMIEKPSSTYKDSETSIPSIKAESPKSPTKSSLMEAMTRTESYSRKSQLLKAKSMHADLNSVSDTSPRYVQPSTNASSNSSLICEEKGMSKSSSINKRVGSSSSFHEYNPNNRIPLKERLRMKQEAEVRNKVSDDETEVTKIITNSELSQRATRLLKKSKEKEREKEESSSFKSRFLRRFRSNKNESSENEDNNRRRRTRPLNEDLSELDLSNMMKERRKSQEEDLRKPSRNSSVSKDETKTSSRRSSGSKSSRRASTSKDTFEEETTIERNKSHKQSRPVSDGEDNIFDETPSKFSDITKSLKDIHKEITSSPKNNENHENLYVDEGEKNSLSMEVVLNESGKTFPNDLCEEESILSTEGYTRQEVKTPVVLRRRRKEPQVTTNTVQLRDKTLLSAVDNVLKNLNRKSVLIYEDNIVPVFKKQTVKHLEFRSPQRSIEEISEEEVSVDVKQDNVIPEYIFETLSTMNRQISEEEIAIIKIKSGPIVNGNDFEIVYQISPAEEPKPFFSEDIVNAYKSEEMKFDQVPKLTYTLPIQNQCYINNSNTEIHEETPTMSQEISTPDHISRIDDMLQEIDQINNEMYDHLLGITKSHQAAIEMENTHNEVSLDNTNPTQLPQRNTSSVFTTKNGSSSIDTKNSTENSRLVETKPTNIENVHIKPKFGRPTLPSLSTAPILSEMIDKPSGTVTTKSLPPTESPNRLLFDYNHPDQQNSTMLNSDDIAFQTFAKYSGRKIEEISGRSIDLTKQKVATTEINASKMIPDNQEAFTQLSVVEENTPKIDRILESLPVNINCDVYPPQEKISPLLLSLNSKSLKSSKPVDMQRTPSPSLAELKTMKLKRTALTSLTKMPSLDSLSTTKKNLTNHEKREAHNNLLQVQGNLSGSLTFLSEVELAPTKENSVSREKLKNDLLDDLYMTKGELRRFSLDDGNVISAGKVIYTPVTTNAKEDVVSKSIRETGVSKDLISITHIEAESNDFQTTVMEANTIFTPSHADTSSNQYNQIEIEQCHQKEDHMNKNDFGVQLEKNDDMLALMKEATVVSMDLEHVDDNASCVSKEEYEKQSNSGKSEVADFIAPNGINQVIDEQPCNHVSAAQQLSDYAENVEQIIQTHSNTTQVYDTIHEAQNIVFNHHKSDKHKGTEEQLEGLSNLKVVEISEAFYTDKSEALPIEKSDKRSHSESSFSNPISRNRSPPYESNEKSRTKSDSEVRPNLEKQMSIKEYRRRKLERQHTSETSFSDESTFEKSDLERSVVSSLADCSDMSDDNQSRNKRYSHSRKDLHKLEGTSESSSESDASLTNYDTKTTHQNGFGHQTELKNSISEPIKKCEEKTTSKYRRNSSGGSIYSQSERRRKNLKYSSYRSVDNF